MSATSAAHSAGAWQLAAAASCPMTAPTSPTTGTAHSKFRPISAPSMSTWMSCASAGMRLQLLVVMLPSEEPATSTTSARSRIALAKSAPYSPTTPP